MAKAPSSQPQPHTKKHDPLRAPPQTIETEKALLGALMIRPEGMAESVDVL